MDAEKFKLFNSIVYPRNVWISRKASDENINYKFKPDTEYLDSIKTGGCIAACYAVIDKETDHRGILCNIESPSLFGVGEIAHESIHIADYICEECGILSQGFKEKNEAYAYLVQWIANCFNKIK